VNDIKMNITKESMIDVMVADDIIGIIEDGHRYVYTFLDSVLRGDGFKPYSQCTEQEIVDEWNNRDYSLDDVCAITESDIYKAVKVSE
jgi:hypothetical protein